MVERLYYTDALMTRFEAVVRACEPDGTVCRVKLERTAFYPTSGGQPCDTGRLGGLHVVDVVDDDDGDIEHVVEGTLTPGQAVAGEIDWDRRFDHMQQHTGQHVLSAAFEKLSGVATESFHLGTETSTIDLAREVSVDELNEAESLASRVVWENRRIAVRFASDEEAAGLPLRKEPARTGRTPSPGLSVSDRVVV
jgi:alanyl-tRNA synthetase